MEKILNIDGVGKAYRVYRSEISRFMGWFGFPQKVSSEFWAVKDISFSISRGEAVALIGENGAGKSTLLKLITGTVQATEGVIVTTGRISAILELGLGFNPEFTGRENIMHSGGLMGFTPKQVVELIPSIKEFAEIGDFFDQPMRTYSSGMYARLAFSLATAVQPDILIVDEVLSVGDSYFQHKSFAKIREFRSRGVSIIMVTHSLGSIREVCDRVILLNKGKILRDGLPDEVIDYYNAMIADRENSKLTIQQKREKNGWMVSRSGTFEAIVNSITLVDGETEEALQLVDVGQRVCLKIEAVVSEALPRLVLGILIRDKNGHAVWGTNTWHTGQIQENVKKGEVLIFKIAFSCNLGPGSYSVSPALVSSSTHLDDNYEWTDNMLVFDVQNFNKPFFIGTSYVHAPFTIERIS